MAQRTDAPARDLRRIWVGVGSWRWAVDWTFPQWGVFAALTFVFAAVLLFVAPYLLLATTVGWFGAGRLVGVLRWSRRRRVAAAAGVAVFLLLLNPDPGGWLRPAPWWLAALTAPTLAFFLTRGTTNVLDTNRPLGYWFHVAHAELTGPRPHRRPRVGDAADVTDLPTTPDLLALRYAALATPPEVAVPWFRPVTTPVEAERWLPADEAAAGAFLAWLTDRGIPHEVTADSWVLLRSGLPEGVARPGEWVVIVTPPHTRRFGRDLPAEVATFPHGVFVAQYEAAEVAAA